MGVSKMMSLEGKVAPVTGGSRGINRAAAGTLLILYLSVPTGEIGGKE